MEPEWLFQLLPAGALFAAILSSATVRSILHTIFRRPRATTVIVEVEGKRLEFNGTEAAKKFSEEHGLLKVAEIQDEKRQRVRGTYRPYRVKGYARFRGDTRKYRNSAKKVKRGKKDE